MLSLHNELSTNKLRILIVEWNHCSTVRADQKTRVSRINQTKLITLKGITVRKIESSDQVVTWLTQKHLLFTQAGLNQTIVACVWYLN